MALKLNGTNSVAAPAYAGADADTGLQCGSDELKLVTGGSARATVDSSGQVGIGTTSPDSLLTLDASSNPTINIKTSGTKRASLIADTGNNYALLGSFEGYPLVFSASAGGGTAERARIDTSGRLLVGSTSARTNFNNGTASPQIQIENVANGNKSSIALIHNENHLSDSSAINFGKTRGGTAGDNSALNQANDRLGTITFQGNDGTEFVQAASIEGFTDGSPGNNDMPGRLSFSVTNDGASSPVERMRINKKGFIKAGPRITDSSNGVADLNSARHEFTSDDNGWTIIVTHTSGAASEHEGILIDYNLDPNGSGNSFLQGNAGGNTRFRVASNGGLYNYQSNNSNLSDEREKKNIVNLDTKWDKVKSWDIKKFHYNEDADDDDFRYGVIAQQVEQHCPEVLAEWIKQSAKDAVLDEDGNVVTPAVAAVTRKGVKEQQMMWMAIKALQEAQTRIETLETQHADLLARVAALEAAS